ncbi:sugar ABC transporter permease [candidate division KSB1 bacterium]|nr:sugar ABC transporter permease [candidate division KSB1 bacterium]
MKKTISFRKKEAREFYLYISPWLCGLVLFTIGAKVASIFISFTRWDIITAPKWVGLENYWEIFFDDPLFWQSLKVTVTYSLVSVPLLLTSSLLVAILLNQKIKALGTYRTIFYLPTVLPAVASTMLWMMLLLRDGLINEFLGLFGIPPTAWLSNENTALWAIIGMSLWGFGTGMIIFLAGLQGIPDQLYEACTIDGANWWHKFWHVTVPMISPIIFFNFIMGVIGTFQVFTQGYIMTNGGPNNATLFYVLYLYRNAFEYFRMGYASALAWVLFFILVILTLIIFKSSSAWVYYEGQRN